MANAYEEDNDVFENLSDIVERYKNSFDGEPETQKSNLNWVDDNCANDIDYVTMENLTHDLLMNEDLFVIKTLTSDNKFKKGVCELKSQLIETLISNRNVANFKNNIPPSNIKCIWEKKRNASQNEENLLNGRCCKSTSMFVFKLTLNMHITMQSLIDILSSENQVWYAVPIFGNKRKRVGNVFNNPYIVSADHGQIPGKIIYKLFTKQQIKEGQNFKEKNLTPFDSLLFNDLRDRQLKIPASRRDSISDMSKFNDTHVKRIVDILMMYYLIGKKHKKLSVQLAHKPKPNKYNYIYTNTIPKDYSQKAIETLINTNDYLPHWLHPKKSEYYKFIDDDMPPTPVTQAQPQSENRFISPELLEIVDRYMGEEESDDEFEQPPSPVSVSEPVQAQAFHPPSLFDILRRFNILESEEQPAPEPELVPEPVPELVPEPVPELVPEPVPEIQEEVRCPPGKELNAFGKCVKKCKRNQSRNPITQRCKKSCKNGTELTDEGKCRKKCKPDQERNPETGRCRKRR
jgi:hypothetical protein